MARVYERKARKDYPDAGIKKGDKYFFWELKTGPASGVTRRSLTRPKPSQLTTSEFKGALYSARESFEAALGSASTFEDLESAREEYKTEMETLRDEQDEKFNNMPEGLQQGDTGQLLESRRDGLEDLISELEGAEIPDSESVIQEIKDDEEESNKPEPEPASKEAVAEPGKEAETEDGDEEVEVDETHDAYIAKLDEVRSELEGFDYGGD